MSRSTEDLIQSLDRAFRRVTQQSQQQQNQSMEQPETLELDFECDTASETTDYEPPASRRRGGRKSNKRTLVLLTSMEVSLNKVPKGKQKALKKKAGMIKEASFRKSSSSKQVIQIISEAFEKALRNLRMRNLRMRNLSIIKVLYFKAEQDPRQRKIVFRNVGENLTGEELLDTFKKSEKPVYVALKLAKEDVRGSQNTATIPTNALVISDVTSLPSSVAATTTAYASTVAATSVTPHATTDVSPAVASSVMTASVTSRMISSTPSADQEQERGPNATDGHAATIRRRQDLLSRWSSTAIDLTSPPSPDPEDGYSSPPSPGTVVLSDDDNDNNDNNEMNETSFVNSNADLPRLRRQRRLQPQYQNNGSQTIGENQVSVQSNNTSRRLRQEILSHQWHHAHFTEENEANSQSCRPQNQPGFNRLVQHQNDQAVTQTTSKSKDKSAIQATLVEDSESFPEIGTTGGCIEDNQNYRYLVEGANNSSMDQDHVIQQLQIQHILAALCGCGNTPSFFVGTFSEFKDQVCHDLVPGLMYIFKDLSCESFADVSLPEALRHVPLYWACLSGSEEEESVVSHIGGMLSVQYPEIVVVCPSLVSTTNVQAIERLAASSALNRNLDVVIQSCGIAVSAARANRSNTEKDQNLIKEQKAALLETEKQKAAEEPKGTEKQKEAEQQKRTEEQNEAGEQNGTGEQTGTEDQNAAEEQKETEQQKETADQNTTNDNDDSFIKNFLRNRKEMEKERLERKAIRQEQNRQKDAEIESREYAQNHRNNQKEMEKGEPEVEKESEKKEKNTKRKMNDNIGIMTGSKQKKLHK